AEAARLNKSNGACCHARPSKILSLSCPCGNPDTVGEFGERYGTGSGSDLVDLEVVTYKAPGRYRSLYPPKESSPRESHPQALAEPYVSLSAHTAPITQAADRKPNRQ